MILQPKQEAADLVLLVSASKVATVLDLSVRTIWAMHSSGRLGPMPIRLGRATRWRAKEIEQWVAAGAPSRDKWLSSPAIDGRRKAMQNN